VKTAVGKKFFQILDECFPEGHGYRKLFNRSTVKLFYSTMDNLEKIMASQNHKILSARKNKGDDVKPCNCRNKAMCPLKDTGDSCRQACVV